MKGYFSFSADSSSHRPTRPMWFRYAPHMVLRTSFVARIESASVMVGG